uniref:Uncharacterized protein n=1 Tax=Parascaris equorum TaxID=6256 RepID=A0A914S4B9_PAREQ
MLNHLHLKEYGNALRQAVEKVIADGKVRTRDLGGYASTSEFTSAVIDNFKMTLMEYGFLNEQRHASILAIKELEIEVEEGLRSYQPR